MKKKLMLLLQALYSYTQINYWQLFKYYNRNSNNIIWLYPLRIKDYFFTDRIINFIGIIVFFIENKKDFRFAFFLNIGAQSNKNIFFVHGKRYNPFGLQNYASSLITLVHELEQQGNKLFPTYNESLLWENKAYMHQLFDKLEINSPKTFLFNLQTKNDFSNIPYPCVYKELHTSGSRGMQKINNQQELENLITIKHEQGVYEFMVQQLVNMRKDLRVIIIGNEIVLHYWRINPSKDWKPTSTSHGSNVDFITFPEMWREKILAHFKKLNITTGGFDITWQNDDVNGEPIFLEISPSYLPNPIPPNPNMAYSTYKYNVFVKKPYWKANVKQIIAFKIKTLKVFEKQHQ